MLWPYANGGAPNIGKIELASLKGAQCQIQRPHAEEAEGRLEARGRSEALPFRCITRGKTHSLRGGQRR